MKDPRFPDIYWHRDLPPLGAEPMAEHTVEATSGRVEGTLAHRDELWDRCYDDLMRHAGRRMMQEMARLGGSAIHVLEESIHSRRDDARREAWLQGRFTYMLYGTPRPAERNDGPRAGRHQGVAAATHREPAVREG